MRMRSLTLFVALLGAGVAEAGEGATPLKIGAAASGPGTVTVFRALRHYLAKNGMPVEFVLYSNYDGLNEALAKKQVDLAWNTPLAHARFHLAHGSQTLVMRDVDVAYRVKVIARQDAGITRLEDLAGKAMVFGSCESADNTVLPVHFLKKAGVNFERVKLLSLHDAVDEVGNPCRSEHHVLAAVLAGRAQAGVISAGLWKHVQAHRPKDAARLREVWTSPPFSHCVFTARKDFPAATGKRFSRLMTAMDGKDALTERILKGEGCTRWVPAGQEAREGFTELLEALREPDALPAALRR